MKIKATSEGEEEREGRDNDEADWEPESESDVVGGTDCRGWQKGRRSKDP